MCDDAITPALLSRARGALLGQAIGDALGTTVEFQTAESIRRRFPGELRELIGGGPFDLLPGQVTDDTELALALGRCLVRKAGFDDNDLAAAYAAWYRSEPFDAGSTTARAFSCAEHGRGPDAAEQMRARASRESQSNGSLMRQSPLAVFGWRLDPHALASLACRESSLSHPHPACREACVAFTHALAYAVRTGALPAEVYEQTLRFMRSRPEAQDARVLEALISARANPPADYYHQMGWVLTALQNAFFRLLHHHSAEEALVKTVAQGGDTDTNACIAGALAGAVWGDSSFPPRWTQALLACRSPRPAAYTCRDLPALAEALVRLGAMQRMPTRP